MGVGLTWGSGREVYKRSEREKGLKNHQGCLIDEYNIDILNKIMPLEMIIFPPRTIDYLTKTLVLGMRNLSNCWSRASKRLPKQ